jgi:iron(III) transport system ATP-binding protein
VSNKSCFLEVKTLRKSYGRTTVLDDVSFEIKEGEFVCFLGPSGCGKTTLLLCLAGLEQPDSGDIQKRERSLARIPPSGRDVGIVFQSYALFPNLSVKRNIAFGLENQKKSKVEVETICAQLMTLLSLTEHEEKFPSQLSGGQQQRVALARALAVSPSLLLLDEPLSALDAQVRARLRGELRDLQSRLGITTIMVTHDQEEAQSLADRIILMNQGRIEQIGTPWEIYNEPATSFVADFIGVSNIFRVRSLGAGEFRSDSLEFRCPNHDKPHNEEVKLLVRPEDIVTSHTKTIHSFAEALVCKIEFLGPLVRLHTEASNKIKIVADLPKKAFERDAVNLGTKLWLSAEPHDIKLLRV